MIIHQSQQLLQEQKKQTEKGSVCRMWLFFINTEMVASLGIINF